MCFCRLAFVVGSCPSFWSSREHLGLNVAGAPFSHLSRYGLLRIHDTIVILGLTCKK